MCSAEVDDGRVGEGRVDDGGRMQLVRAAIELVGARGRARTTVRAIAERAGVSAPLVMHHFGSKDGLLEAADEHVRSVMAAAMVHVTDDVTMADSEATVQALLSVPDVAAALTYVAGAIRDDTELGRWWFDELLGVTSVGVARMVELGVARPTDDPEMRALLLVAMDLGLVLMRPLVEARLGADLADPAITERWVRAEFDLLSRGLLVAPPPTDTAAPTTAAPNEPVARPTEDDTP